MEKISESAQKWIAGIASGTRTMSQRKADKILKTDGGLEALVAEAKKHGVHLLKLTDDKGDVLVAGSLKPFEVLC